MNIILNEEIDNECPPKFNPREMENKLMLGNQRMRVYQIGKKFYAKTSECSTQNNQQNKSNWSNIKLIIELIDYFSFLLYSKQKQIAIRNLKLMTND